MTEQNIYDIIKMRMAVYKAGVKTGFWEDVDQSGASEMMNYIFPKSGNIAYYNIVMELMRKLMACSWVASFISLSCRHR